MTIKFRIWESRWLIKIRVSHPMPEKYPDLLNLPVDPRLVMLSNCGSRHMQRRDLPDYVKR